MNRHIIGSFVAVFMLVSGSIMLGGCASPLIAPSPSLAQAGPPRTITRLLTFTSQHNDQSPNHVIAIIKLTGTSLKAAILTPEGQRVMTLVRDDQGSRYENVLGQQPPIPAQWLAERLEWGLWPTAALTSAFVHSRWHLAGNGDDRHEGHRAIFHDNRLIVRITYIRNEYNQVGSSSPTNDEALTVRMDDYEAGYELEIVPIEAPSM